MPKLPRITGDTACAAFAKAGYECCRVHGSHHILKHEGKRERLSIPVHGDRILGAGLLRSQIRIAGLTDEEFVALL